MLVAPPLGAIGTRVALIAALHVDRRKPILHAARGARAITGVALRRRAESRSAAGLGEAHTVDQVVFIEKAVFVVDEVARHG
jgi:hypothetical protein